MRIDSVLRAKVGGILGVISAILIVSATGISERQMNNTSRTPASADEFLDWVRELRSPFVSDPLTDKDCVSRLNWLSDAVTRSNPARYELSDVERGADQAIRELFALRMLLLDQARPILQRGKVSETCALSLRRAFRHLRGAEDYIGAIGYQALLKKAVAESSASVASSREGSARDNTRVTLPPIKTPILFPKRASFPVPSYLPPSTLLNPSLRTAPGVRSGDVLLSRGNAATSALIARMANEDTQFSHMALVYVDPNGKAWTIEAHIEFGSIVTPLDQWLSDGKARTMIFRHADAEVAHAAAEHMFRRVAPLYRADRAVEYDFAFDMHDHSKLFCSEVVREGYRLASSDRIMVPWFPSRIAMRNRDLMNRLGISESASFIPGDIELDPRFQVIGEWRNFEKLPDVWQKDAVLTSIYTWLERDGYRFNSTRWLEVKGKIAKTARKAGMLKDKLPPYMPHDAIVLSFMLDTMTAELQERLAALDAKKRTQTGFPATYYDFLEELERIRKSQGPGAQGPFRFLHK